MQSQTYIYICIACDTVSVTHELEYVVWFTELLWDLLGDGYAVYLLLHRGFRCPGSPLYVSGRQQSMFAEDLAVYFSNSAPWHFPVTSALLHCHGRSKAPQLGEVWWDVSYPTVCHSCSNSWQMLLLGLSPMKGQISNHSNSMILV